MKLLSSTQIRAWDNYTILNEPVNSTDLMERAAQRCTDFIVGKYPATLFVKIFCGKGNNGGDGLAVARQLLDAGYQVGIYIPDTSHGSSADFEKNLQRLKAYKQAVHFINDTSQFPDIQSHDLVLDALFGNGLNRPLQGLPAKLVAHINASLSTVISIDIPSGLFLDKSSAGNTIILAKYTLSFQLPKLCFLVPENEAYFGEVIVLDIGLHPSYLKNVSSPLQIGTLQETASLLQKRSVFSNKRNFGHALLIAGSKGKMGAPVLAARACLRAGVGLLTVNSPQSELSILQNSLPEAMCMERESIPDFSRYRSIGIGPGMGTGKEASSLLSEVFSAYTKPIVIDADAITLLAADQKLLSKIPAGSILTPHETEFDRLMGAQKNRFDRIAAALALSQQYPIIIILKGHYSLIAFEGKGMFNTTGNPGMAKGGSGDVLTGILTALLAQGYRPYEAAVLGTCLHGLAGDLGLLHQSEESLIATDIIENLGAAFSYLKSSVDTNHKL